MAVVQQTVWPTAPFPRQFHLKSRHMQMKLFQLFWTPSHMYPRQRKTIVLKGLKVNCMPHSVCCYWKVLTVVFHVNISNFKTVTIL